MIPGRQSNPGRSRDARCPVKERHLPGSVVQIEKRVRGCNNLPEHQHVVIGSATWERRAINPSLACEIPRPKSPIATGGCRQPIASPVEMATITRAKWGTYRRRKRRIAIDRYRVCLHVEQITAQRHEQNDASPLAIYCHDSSTSAKPEPLPCCRTSGW